MYAGTLISTPGQAQNKTEAIAYGANAAAGHDLTVDNTQIYYEIYGSGGNPYNQTAKFVELFQLLTNGELAVIPGCGHVVLDCKGPFTITAVAAFLNKHGK
jgi:hypothetical protein